MNADNDKMSMMSASIVNELFREEGFDSQNWIDTTKLFYETYKEIDYVVLTGSIYTYIENRDIDRVYNCFTKNNTEVTRQLKRLEESSHLELEKIYKRYNISEENQSIFSAAHLAVKESSENKNHLKLSEFISFIKALFNHIYLTFQLVIRIEGKVISVYNKATKEIDNRIIVAEEKTKEAMKSEIQSTEKNYIAILGIFASVVVTLAGGFSFSSVALEHLHELSFSRLAFGILVLATFTSNILYALFYFIAKLVYKRNIFGTCLLIILNSSLGLSMLVFGMIEISKPEPKAPIPTYYPMIDSKKLFHFHE